MTTKWIETSARTKLTVMNMEFVYVSRSTYNFNLAGISIVPLSQSEQSGVLIVFYFQFFVGIKLKWKPAHLTKLQKD